MPRFAQHFVGNWSIYEKHGRVAVITINRPEVLNALHPDADDELYEFWQDFNADDDLWVAIVTGAGERSFCTGFDLKWADEHGGHSPVGRQRSPFGGIAARAGDRPFHCVKPIIAAVNGFAYGGGMEVCLNCDLVIAVEEARFGLQEVRWSLIPAGGGVSKLVHQVPLNRALALLFTGKSISAQDAYEMGLVNEIVPRDRLLEAAHRWADEIMQCGPLAVRAIKEAVYAGLGHPYDFAHNRHYDSWDKCFWSQDVKEGLQAFREKRAPRWEGK